MLPAGQIREQSKPSDPLGDPIGHVHSVCGSQASIGLLMPGGGSVLQERTTVGRFVKIQTGNALLVAVVTEISMQESPTARDQGYQATARVDLMARSPKSAPTESASSGASPSIPPSETRSHQ
jgi:hypothetical protein